MNELIVKYHEARAVCDTAAELTDYLQERADKILDEIVTTKPTTYAGCRHKIIVLASDEHSNYAAVIVERAVLMIELDAAENNHGPFVRRRDAAHG